MTLIPEFIGFGQTSEKEGLRKNLEILIVGTGTENYVPYIIHSLNQFGRSGVSSQDINKFRVLDAFCETHPAKMKVYDGNTGVINLKAVKEVNVIDIEPLKLRNGEFTVDFYTPYQAKTRVFPPDFETFVQAIRRRLIAYTNEYGNGERVPDTKCTGKIIKTENVRRHTLYMHSSRSGKLVFPDCYTGKVTYKISRPSRNLKWILACANMIGCGPKASYGMGAVRL